MCGATPPLPHGVVLIKSRGQLYLYLTSFLKSSQVSFISVLIFCKEMLVWCHFGLYRHFNKTLILYVFCKLHWTYFH